MYMSIYILLNPWHRYIIFFCVKLTCCKLIQNFFLEIANPLKKEKQVYYKKQKFYFLNYLKI